MRPKHITGAACAACALAVPAVALADPPRLDLPPDRSGPTGELREAVHEVAVKRHLRAEKLHDRLQGERLRRSERREIREDLSELGPGQVRRKTIRLRRDIRELRERLEQQAQARAAAPTAATASAGGGQAAPASGGGAPGNLEAIAACESGGDPNAVGGGGAYRGKYQFDQQTWESVGGTGDPAAAPEAEQDARAAQLMAQRGSSPWPVCG